MCICLFAGLFVNIYVYVFEYEHVSLISVIAYLSYLLLNSTYIDLTWVANSSIPSDKLV